MGKHYHPGDAFAYILEGTMLLEIVGKESVTLKAGQSGSLPPGTVHDDKNASQTAPLKFLVFHSRRPGDGSGNSSCVGRSERRAPRPAWSE